MNDIPSAETLKLSREGLAAFLDQAFPVETRHMLGTLVSVEPGHVRTMIDPDPSMLRPGGLISGPIQMGLADVAAYGVILAHVGPMAMVVTSNLSINFLRSAPARRLYADARLLKLGRRLASVDVRLWQESEDRLISQAMISCALP